MLSNPFAQAGLRPQSSYLPSTSLIAGTTGMSHGVQLVLEIVLINFLHRLAPNLDPPISSYGVAGITVKCPTNWFSYSCIFLGARKAKAK
jgi:hypothetical protein